MFILGVDTSDHRSLASVAGIESSLLISDFVLSTSGSSKMIPIILTLPWAWVRATFCFLAKLAVWAQAIWSTLSWSAKVIVRALAICFLSVESLWVASSPPHSSQPVKPKVLQIARSFL